MIWWLCLRSTCPGGWTRCIRCGPTCFRNCRLFIEIPHAATSNVRWRRTCRRRLRCQPSRRCGRFAERSRENVRRQRTFDVAACGISINSDNCGSRLVRTGCSASIHQDR